MAGDRIQPDLPDSWLNEAGYRDGHRVCDDEGLEDIPGPGYENQAVIVTPGNELTCFRETAQAPSVQEPVPWTGMSPAGIFRK